MAAERLTHQFAPVYNAESKVLILGTFPSVKSRENRFFYGHPQNRFWKVTAGLTGEPVPQTIEEKKQLLLKHHIAIWDVVSQCDIEGSSDSSIRNVVPADLSAILRDSQVKAIFANGSTAARLYGRYQKKQTGMEIITLPSTSPANAAYSLQRLLQAWSVIRTYLQDGEKETDYRNIRNRSETMTEKVRLGRTEILADKNGFGALPIQRISAEEAGRLLRKAFESGVNFFDTARYYTDSERKIGMALGDVRDQIYIASKTMALTGEELEKDLETSLRELGTDYIDLYQLHNTYFCPKPGGEDGLYDALLRAKADGKIRHIGITNHRLAVAEEAIASGLYETLQFPFSYLSGEAELRLVKLCEEADMGFIAMKGMAGGLLQDGRAAYAYLSQYPSVLPIWGVQREAELDQFLSCSVNPPSVEEESIQKTIEKDRSELLGEFCRGCGYCMPCPVGIKINDCARLSLMIRRAPSAPWLSEENQAAMAKIEDCLECGQCSSRCPYGLDTPALLKKNLQDYKEILAGKSL